MCGTIKIIIDLVRYYIRSQKPPFEITYQIIDCVVEGEGHVLHFGTLPEYAFDSAMELLDWVKTSGVHILICSYMFHNELELIYSFADGTERVGRLWHTLQFSKLNPAFAWLPVEFIAYER